MRHAEGVVHRDVKPANVLVTPEGQAKLSDLGLAGPLSGAAENDPRYGKIVGTADYLSPDQVRDPWTPTPAWDIYSLGCTLYYAVTGKVPFPGGSTADKARAHCELRPMNPRHLNPRLSADFIDTMADMMAKEPAQRIGSAVEVVARMAPFLTPPVPPTVGMSHLYPPGQMASVPFSAPSRPVRPLPVPPPIVAPQKNEDEDSSREMQIPSAHDAMGAWWPLTAFVLAPLALAGGVLFVWWLARLLR